MKRIKYNKFQPCEHKGCLRHLSHPCENCGRIGGNGVVYEDDELTFDDLYLGLSDEDLDIGTGD